MGKCCFGNRRIAWIEMELQTNARKGLDQLAYDGKQNRNPKNNDDKSDKNDKNPNTEPDP